MAVVIDIGSISVFGFLCITDILIFMVACWFLVGEFLKCVSHNLDCINLKCIRKDFIAFSIIIIRIQPNSQVILDRNMLETKPTTHQ